MGRMWNAWTTRCEVLLLLVVGAAVLFPANADKIPITLHDPLGSTEPKYFNASWYSDTELLYVLDYSLEMVKYNVETGVETTVINRTLMTALGFVQPTFSADKKWVSIIHDYQMVFRNSILAKYKLVELETGTMCELAGGQDVQLLVWAPVGHALAFVQDNDLFYQSVHCPSPNAQRITDSPNYMFNGIADWVYEEEVLGDSKFLRFSPDGKKLVFCTVNDVNVHNMTLWKYNEPDTVESQYVERVDISYPKVGTSNPTATLNYVDLEQTPIKFKPVATPVELVSNDNILGPLEWADNTHFSATWMTRLQNKAYTLVCNSQDLKCTQLLEQVEEKGWLTITRPIFINQTAFLTVLPRDQGGQYGKYRHLCLVSADRVVALTSGLDVVANILKYDQQTGIVFYTGIVNGDSAQKHVFSVPADGKGSSKCLSCQTGCRYNLVDFSTDASYYILVCYGTTNPFKADLFSKDGRLVKHLIDNKVFVEELNKFDLPAVKNLEVSVPNGFIAKVRMFVPSNLTEDGSIKYPVLFSVYSGPDSIKITDTFKFPGFEDYLISSRGVIIVNIDGRGSSLRGDNIKFEMYQKLGGPEIEDILEVARYLQSKLPYVDAKRTAIWGWSYGGYATAMTLAKDKDQLFKCGISVAPVTNWLYYDSIWTERYMGLPTKNSNLQGYEASDIISKVENFRHKLFYLIHGNFDDNVHYQQSMALSKALEHADIQFYQQSYPDENHGLMSVRNHLVHSMDRFWTKCFQLEEPVHDSSQRSSNSSSSRWRYDYLSSRGFQRNWELQGKFKSHYDFI